MSATAMRMMRGEGVTASQANAPALQPDYARTFGFQPLAGASHDASDAARSAQMAKEKVALEATETDLLEQQLAEVE